MTDAAYERKTYDRIADINAEDSLGKIFKRIPTGSTILDVGVGSGALGQMVQTNNVGPIDGVDIDRRMLERARPFYRNLFKADIDAVDPLKIWDRRRYDVIVVADIIEHLKDPARAVKLLSQVLTPDGKMLFSVPNATYLGLICELASGNFRYNDEGLLDKTHLRFFSFDSLTQMINQSGLRITHQDTVQMPLALSEFKNHDPAYYLNMDNLLDRPHLLTYQFIVEAQLDRQSC